MEFRNGIYGSGLPRKHRKKDFIIILKRLGILPSESYDNIFMSSEDEANISKSKSPRIRVLDLRKYF